MAQEKELIYLKFLILVVLSGAEVVIKEKWSFAS
jgi:hypothetical protein